ncbi:hypothetical protein KI387_037492, partial [Taxus chinensis]
LVRLLGKASTDGNASTIGKGGILSLDALAKAKKALQIQKDLSEKLKKLPQLNKYAGTSSIATSSSTTALTVGEVSLKSPASTSSSVPVAMKNSATVQSKAYVLASMSASMPISAGNMNFAPRMTGVGGHANISNYEAVKRAQKLVARMGFHQDTESMSFFIMFPGQMSDEFGTAGQQKPAKAPILRLDAQGREIDENGNVINKPKITNLSTIVLIPCSQKIPENKGNNIVSSALISLFCNV